MIKSISLATVTTMLAFLAATGIVYGQSQNSTPTQLANPKVVSVEIR